MTSSQRTSSGQNSSIDICSTHTSSSTSTLKTCTEYENFLKQLSELEEWALIVSGVRVESDYLVKKIGQLEACRPCGTRPQQLDAVKRMIQLRRGTLSSYIGSSGDDLPFHKYDSMVQNRIEMLMVEGTGADSEVQVNHSSQERSILLTAAQVATSSKTSRTVIPIHHPTQKDHNTDVPNRENEALTTQVHYPLISIALEIAEGHGPRYDQTDEPVMFPRDDYYTLQFMILGKPFWSQFDKKDVNSIAVLQENTELLIGLKDGDGRRLKFKTLEDAKAVVTDLMDWVLEG